jgi:hypothetical protein
MSTETPPKERSVPKPAFTDAEAGSKEFPSSNSRAYNYFTPAKRRASVYEDVTVDVQPDPERHLTQGWIYGFADGTSGYPKEWTKVESSNWHEFLDPNEEWEQTIYRNNANVVRQVQHNIANAKDAGAFAQWNKSWVAVVAKHVGAWAHAEHGLGMHVYTPAQRDAPTNMINNAMAVGAVHKLRFAQDLILYNLALSEEVEGFDGAAHKDAWQNDPIWQPTREHLDPRRVHRLEDVRGAAVLDVLADLADDVRVVAIDRLLPLLVRVEELVPVGRLERRPLVWIAAGPVGEGVDPALREVAGRIRLDVDRDVLVHGGPALAGREVVVAAAARGGELLGPRLGIREDGLRDAAFLDLDGHALSSQSSAVVVNLSK